MLCPAVSKGMWGAKKKRESDEAQLVEAGGGFETSRRAAAAAMAARGGAGAGLGSRFGTGGVGSKEFSDQVRLLIETYVTMMEQAVNSPEFAGTVTPEAIRGMVNQVPGLSDNPQVATMLDSPEFTDPEKLMETVRTGITTLKTYINDIVDALNDPTQVEAMVSQLPAEYQGAVTRMMAGDTSGVSSLLDDLPNITPAQKKMIKNLISGDLVGVTESARSMFNEKGSQQLEDARQMLLKNPEMLEAMGLDIATVMDEEKFAALMEQSLSLFAQQLNGADGDGDGTGAGAGAGAGEDEEGVGDVDDMLSKLFSASAAA